MVFIYVLKLEQGKYYIGKTNKPQFRLNNHFNSNGSEWTKKYKPIKVLDIKKNCDNYDEDKYTRKYMDKYGINNVRGGSFVTIKLSDSEIDILKKMNNGTNDKCFICGKKGHFAKHCKEDEYFAEFCKEEEDYFKSNNEKFSNIKISNEKNNKITSKISMNKIQYDFNYESESASSDDYVELWCCENCNREFETKKSLIFHKNVYCKKRKKIKKKKVFCSRCGRNGHYISSCYASKDINGRYLKKNNISEKDLDNSCIII